MAENKLEIKVMQDSTERVVELNSMSPEAAIAFSKIITALAEIVANTPGAEGINIGLIRGSAAAVAGGTTDQINAINNCFEEVVKNQCTINEVVSPWRDIQALFKSNGLYYEASFKIENKSIPIYSKIKENKKFITKTPREKREYELCFYKGELSQAGGNNPNLHIKVDSQERPLIIDCSPASAKKATRFLYENIMISAWKHGQKGNPKYCDTYANETQFKELELFIEKYNKIESKVDALIFLHDKCVELIKFNEFKTLRKLMRLFDHDSIDINEVKTILVVTKSFKDFDDIDLTRKSLLQLFNQKIPSKSK